MACQMQKSLTAASPAPAAASVNRVANQFAPEIPQVTYAKNYLSWLP